MIDWHSHILPQMDDGSHSTAESLSLIKMLTEQNVETVVATPHFYANDESVEDFIKRREKSYKELADVLNEKSPEILLGAEVRYYPGISKLSDLKRLCIEGTDMLMLEMPTGKWTEYALRELEELSSSGTFKIVLAHIERYLKQQSNDIWKRLYESGILMQVNSDFFVSLKTRRKALRILSDGRLHFIGSDCHNTTSRIPKIGKAVGIIEKNLGKDFVSQMHKYGNVLLKNNQT